MKTFLFVLIALGALATLAVLVRGVIGMANGRDLTGQRSQELMRKRVLYQAVTIVIVVLFLAVASAS
jgi:hypothetical protein